MAFLELKNIIKEFGPVRTIKGVDLAINRGEFIVFVGPSGCGKSTLLRLIAGLESITSGSLALDGRDITNTPSSKRDLAMVFQSYALYPHMTVFDNMSFALKLAKVDPAVRKEKVERAAKILNLTQYLDRTPKQLSGGQRQRVAIGRAIVRAPKVFLFDEPLSNLDAALRGQTRVEIANLHRSLGATTIYVTHDQIEAMTLADRVVVLRDGMIEQVGSPLELYDRPANQFVAQFIGTPQMNVVDTAKLPALREVVGAANAPDGFIGVPRLPADGSVGVRPEYLRIARGGEGIAGTVELVEALGSDTLIHAKVAGDVHLISRQGDRTTLKLGDPVSVQIDPKALLYFDKQGRALRDVQQAA
jgi:multiple sugar transport system ATP-binding protein